jgi:hypothetical protein
MVRHGLLCCMRLVAAGTEVGSVVGFLPGSEYCTTLHGHPGSIMTAIIGRCIECHSLCAPSPMVHRQNASQDVVRGGFLGGCDEDVFFLSLSWEYRTVCGFLLSIRSTPARADLFASSLQYLSLLWLSKFESNGHT